MQNQQPKLREPTFIQVNQIEPGVDGYNVYVKIMEIEKFQDAKEQTVVKGKCGDESAIIDFQFNGKFVNVPQIDSVIAIRNGLSCVELGHHLLKINQYGKLTEEKHEIKYVNDKLNKSQWEYKAVLVKKEIRTQNKPYYKENSNYQIRKEYNSVQGKQNYRNKRSQSSDRQNRQDQRNYKPSKTYNNNRGNRSQSTYRVKDQTQDHKDLNDPKDQKDSENSQQEKKEMREQQGNQKQKLEKEERFKDSRFQQYQKPNRQRNNYNRKYQQSYFRQRYSKFSLYKAKYPLYVPKQKKPEEAVAQNK